MEILEQSGSQRAIENLLKVYYEPLEFWFLRMSIEKVHALPVVLWARWLMYDYRPIRSILPTSPPNLTSPPSSMIHSTFSNLSYPVSSHAARSLP